MTEPNGKHIVVLMIHAFVGVKKCMYVIRDVGWYEGGKRMATVFDVTKYILHKCGEMSTWKLQKLCYYSQAWHLAWTDNPIFEEDFEAWANGPVCSELFHAHQGKFLVSMEDFCKGNEDNLSEDEKESIDIVLDGYGQMEPYSLREQTHAEDPWKNARRNLPEWAKSRTVITKSSMGEYYGSL